MPVFKYVAKAPDGKKVSKTIEAPTSAEAAQHLREEGYFPISIKAVGQGKGFDLVLFERLKTQDLIMFTRQLVTLYRAGIPLVTGLAALEQQATTALMKKICRKLREDVQGGKSLSGAFADQPKFFDDLYVNTVRAGEKGGVLDTVLDRLAKLIERDFETRQQVKGALRYPMFVVIALAGAMVVLLTMVVPKFEGLFSKFNEDLPLPTQILLGTSKLLKQQTHWVLLALVLAVLGIRTFLRSDKGRLWWDGVRLKLPVFGTLLLKVSMSRFATMFGTLAKSGVPVLSNLEICASTLGNVAIGRELMEARAAVEKGGSLSAALDGSSYFTPMLVHMLAVGERSGDVEGMMEVVAGHYEMECGYTIRNLTSLIEPILTLVMGIMILFVALSIFMPLWNITKVFKK